MQVWLQNWIMNYVDGDPAHSSEATKAHEAACRSGGTGCGGGRQSGVLFREVLPSSALPARRIDSLVTSGFEAAVPESGLACVRFREPIVE